MGIGRRAYINQLSGTLARNAIEIAAFVAVVVADALGLVPLTQTIFLFPWSGYRSA